MKDVTGEWIKQYNNELHNLYCSLNIIRVIKLENEKGGACGMNEQMRNVYKILFRKPKGKTTWGTQPQLG
jgi:hypothetical protein